MTKKRIKEVASCGQPVILEAMGRTLNHHPIANLFPEMTGSDYDALVKDIKSNGLIEPITLFEGKILDGRNRARACLEAEIEPA
jgi:ParB-like chromosome segregation protein Spo0J